MKGELVQGADAQPPAAQIAAAPGDPSAAPPADGGEAQPPAEGGQS
jgi:hypothetical protein